MITHRVSSEQYMHALKYLCMRTSLRLSIVGCVKYRSFHVSVFKYFVLFIHEVFTHPHVCDAFVPVFIKRKFFSAVRYTHKSVMHINPQRYNICIKSRLITSFGLAGDGCPNKKPFAFSNGNNMQTSFGAHIFITLGHSDLKSRDSSFKTLATEAFNRSFQMLLLLDVFK